MSATATRTKRKRKRKRKRKNVKSENDHMWRSMEIDYNLDLNTLFELLRTDMPNYKMDPGRFSLYATRCEAVLTELLDLFFNHPQLSFDRLAAIALSLERPASCQELEENLNEMVSIEDINAATVLLQQVQCTWQQYLQSNLSVLSVYCGSTKLSPAILLFLNLCKFNVLFFAKHHGAQISGLDIGYVVTNMLCGSPDFISAYKVSDIVWSLYILQRKWTRQEYSMQLVQYLLLLEMRAAFLIVGDGPPSVYDQVLYCQQPKGPVDRQAYDFSGRRTVKIGFVAYVCIVITALRQRLTFFHDNPRVTPEKALQEIYDARIERARAQDNAIGQFKYLRTMYTDIDTSGRFYIPVDGWSPEDYRMVFCDQEGHPAWARFLKLMDTIHAQKRTSSFMGGFRKWLMQFLVWPSSQSLFQRKRGNILPNTQALIDFQFGKEEVSALYDQFNAEDFARICSETQPNPVTKAPEHTYIRSLLIVYMVHMYLRNECQDIEFLTEFVIFEHNYKKYKENLAQCEYPVLIQLMNRFDVYCGGMVINCRDVYSALYRWLFLLWRFTDGDIHQQFDLSDLLRSIFGDSGSGSEYSSGEDNDQPELIYTLPLYT